MTDFAVNTQTAHNQFEPALAALPDGRIAYVWHDWSGTFCARARIYDPADPSRTVDFDLSPGAAGSFLPSVAAMADGRVVFTWSEMGQVLARIADPDDPTAGPVIQIDATPEGAQQSADVADLGDGRLVFSWFVGGSSPHIRARIYDPAAPDANDDFAVSASPLVERTAPEATVLSDGRLLFTWSAESYPMAGASRDVRARVVDPADPGASAEFRVNTTTPGSQLNPAAAALADGRIVFAWQDDMGASGAVRCRVVDPADPYGSSDFLIQETPYGVRGEPAVAALPDGRVVVAWAGVGAGGGDRSEIRAIIFRPDHPERAAELVVNATLPASYQGSPVVSVMADGRLAFAWSSPDDDGLGVRGAIIDPGSNAAPVLNLPAGPAQPFVENGVPVVVAPGGSVFDAELWALDDYADAVLTLERADGPSPQDVFATTNGVYLENGRVICSGYDVGSFSQASGTLSIAFGAGATQARVDQVVRGLTYANLSEAPPESVRVTWRFTDGDPGDQAPGGPLTGHGETTVDILARPDLPQIVAIPDHYKAAVGQPIMLKGLTFADIDASSTLVILGVSAGRLLDENTAPESGGSSLGLYGTVAEINARIRAGGIRFVAGDDAVDAILTVDVVDEVAGSYGDVVSASLNIRVLDHRLGQEWTDRLIGSDKDSRLEALGGDDTLDGRGGDDTLEGGTGVDVLYSGAGDDLMDGGEGRDIAAYIHAPGAVRIDLNKAGRQATGAEGRDKLIGLERFYGSDHDDVIRGAGADELLDGWNGDDTISGGAGNDDMNGGEGVDAVSYAGAAAGVRVDLSAWDVQDTGAGVDRLMSFEHAIGSSHDDILSGDGQANRLEGGAGADTLFGAGAADTLVGGLGKDELRLWWGAQELTGGAGRDRFVVSWHPPTQGGPTPMITDLTDDDRIDFSVFAQLWTGDGPPRVTWLSDFDGVAGQLTLTYDGVATSLLFDYQGDDVADVELLLLGDHTGFTRFVI